MNVGGVEKSFLGLLSALPLTTLDVHVGLIHRRGGYLESFPPEVQIHDVSVYAQYWREINDPPLQTIKSYALRGKILGACVHALLYLHFKLTGSQYWLYKYLLRNEPLFPIAFDLAVAFAGPSQMMDYYVCQKVRAKAKCGWIHFDISKFGIDKGMTARLYRQYNKVFVVSETAKRIFDETFPQFRGKTEVFYNIVSPDQVRQLAAVGETFSDDFTGKRLLTVGRISEEKGQRVALEALKLLRGRGYDVKWYFVGTGKDLAYCEARAVQLGLSEYAQFLGLRMNPYGYMRDCDIYVQPSRHEGFCITLAEALCFGQPIVATDFTGAAEQLKHRINSRVVGMDAEELAVGIENFWEAERVVPSVDSDTPSHTDIDKLVSLFGK